MREELGIILMESFLLIAKSLPSEYFTLSFWGPKTGKSVNLRNEDVSFGHSNGSFANISFFPMFKSQMCSSKETKMRAKQLADEIGAWHLDVCIDGVVSAVLSLFQTVTGKRPRYKVKQEFRNS